MPPLPPTLARILDDSRDTLIHLQKILTSIPALAPQNGGTGEWPKARALCDALAALDFPPPVFLSAPDPRVPEGSRPNILFKLAGSPPHTADPTRWFIAHLDVVPPGQGWSRDPFILHVDGDRLVGRGTLDNHQGIVSSVLAFHALLRAGLPHCPVALLLVSDEETGNAHGLQFLLEHHALFGPHDLLIVPDAGNPQSTMIEVAEKSLLWLKVETRGLQSHASYPAGGKNALLAAAKLIARLATLYDLFPQTDPLFDPPFSTFEPTQKPANGIDSINTIPGEDVFYLDCRLLPSCDPQQVIAAINAMAQEIQREMSLATRYAPAPLAIDVSVVSQNPPAAATSPAAPVVRAIQSAILEIYGVDAVPVGIGGATAAGLLRRRGFPAAVWATMDEVAHHIDEYSRISFTLNDARVFAHLCLYPA